MASPDIESCRTWLSNIDLPFLKSKSTFSTSVELPNRSPSSSQINSGENIDHEALETASTTQAWLQVLVNHLVMMNSFGLIQSFGIFQFPYEHHLSASPSKVAWIGSIHIFFVYFLGTFSGWALDRGYYKRMLLIGSIFQITGLIAAGFSNSWWTTFLFHGVFQGMGHGLMFCPAVTTTANYFRDSRLKMTALGIAGCGASTGGIVFPLIAKYTINSLGIAITLWIMCGVVWFISILIQVLARSGPRRTYSSSSQNMTRIVEWRAFKDTTYALYVGAMLFVFVGLWIPFFYIREFSATALHTSKSTSFVILTVLNAAGIPGRVVPALLSDRCIGTINTYILTLVITGVTLLCWPHVKNTTGMILWSMGYGFGAGGVSSLLQAGLTSLNDEPAKTGIRIGMAFSVVGFASLLGGPVGGEFIRIGQETRKEGTDAYVLMMLFTGSIMLSGTAILCVVRGAKTRWGFWIKV
jgi:MFS family permease